MAKEAHIPKGIYCYDESGLCPYWDIDETKSDGENGFCHYLQEGDWQCSHISLLWDQVKECGINDDLE